MQAETNGMDFGEALAAMRAGRSVRRKGWKSRGMYVLLRDGESTTNTLPSFVMHTARQQWQPGWLAATNDLLAADWETI